MTPYKQLSVSNYNLGLRFVAATSADRKNDKLVLTKPAGTINGDLLIVCVVDNDATFAAPSGWTLVASKSIFASNVGFLKVLYKVANNEPVSYQFDSSTGVLLTWRYFSSVYYAGLVLTTKLAAQISAATTVSGCLWTW